MKYLLLIILGTVLLTPAFANMVDFSEITLEDLEDIETQRMICDLAKESSSIRYQSIIPEQQSLMVQTLIEKEQDGSYYGTSYQSLFEREHIVFFKMEHTAENTVKLGYLCFDTIIEGEEISKYKITGGALSINGETFEFMFGKSRVVGNSMIVIGQVVDQQNEVHTAKLIVKTSNATYKVFAQGVIDDSVYLDSKSSISGEMNFGGIGIYCDLYPHSISRGDV